MVSMPHGGKTQVVMSVYYYIYTGTFEASSIKISYPMSHRAPAWNILSLVLLCDLRVLALKFERANKKHSYTVYKLSNKAI
jgi:hypothetical protein